MHVKATANVFELIDGEVWVVAASDGARQNALIATFFTQASIVPDIPRVIIGLAKQHLTRQMIEASGVFAAHLITEQHLDWVWKFGLQTGRETDKLAGMTIARGETGAPILADALAWIECRVEASMDTGDRSVYLAEVVAAEVRGSAAALTVKRLLELAPQDKLRELREQVERDSRLDKAAIRAWRQRRSDATN